MNEFSSDQSQPRLHSRRRRAAIIGVVAIAAATTVTAVAGVPLARAATASSASGNAITAAPARGDFPWSAGSGAAGSGANGYPGAGGYGYGGYGSGSDGSGGYGSGGSGGYAGGSGQSSDSTVTGTAATAAESTGIAIIQTEIDYGQAEAAGTGMVLTANGEVLTNNHVVAGSTAVEVEIVSTGKVYQAQVVGTDATDDVAVLQLQGASGLATARLDTAEQVQVGDAVTGVGNAEGQGSLAAAAGTVTGLDKSITTQAEQLAASESLTGLIETDAAIQSGDSGGPLYDAAGGIVGMDTAASSGGAADSYAIPIAQAVRIAASIEAGSAGTGDGVAQGTPAFLGVEVATDPAVAAGTAVDGAQIVGVVPGGPADAAGLVAGDVITSVGGTDVGSADALGTVIAQYTPGSRVGVVWTDAAGQTHEATVTLASGPAA